MSSSRTEARSGVRPARGRPIPVLIMVRGGASEAAAMAASSSGSACSSANCVPGDGGCPCVAASATYFCQTFSGTSPRCAKHGSHMCCQQPGPLHPASLNAWHFVPVSCQAPAAAQSLPKHGHLACESFSAPRVVPAHRHLRDAELRERICRAPLLLWRSPAEKLATGVGQATHVLHIA